MADYRHLLSLTDDTGILQFSILEHPNPLSGHTLDDNARALIVSLSMEDGQELAKKYARYLYKAYRPDGSWSNFFLNGQYSSDYDSEDSVGRALMACCLGAKKEACSQICSQLIQWNLPSALRFSSPRAIAYTLIGLCKGSIPYPEPTRLHYISVLSSRLLAFYQNTHSRHWLWFENNFTYCNGILPQALFAAFQVNGDKKLLKAARDSIGFLNGILFRKGYLNIIGNQGWMYRGKSPALFDQQPVDAASTALACFEAYLTIGDIEYLELAVMAHRWYRGKNIHGLSLYDSSTGGCYDALTAEGVNRNQGAEAVLSLLLTDQTMKAFVKQRPEMEQPS
ncbi:MAG: hypothetical protein ACOXZ5_03370 [Syntrophomonadaceae bacterium]|jgi:hypothetical protein